MLYLFILLIISGCITGVLAGLLGIGGGLIIIPVLAYVFYHSPETANAYMQYAAGSSLGIMIFTAIASVPHKLKKREVNFSIVAMMAPWIIISDILGAVVARFLNAKVLGILFAVLLMSMFLRMLLQSTKLKEPKRNSKRKMAFWGSLVGFKSGVFGIGGGIITIPYIHSLGHPIRTAIGTSSLFTLIISVVGSITFVITGLTSIEHIDWSLGYVYLPAVLCVAPTSMIFSKIGARLSSKTSPTLLKVIFLSILFISTVKMIWLAI